MSPWGQNWSREMEARAAAVQSAADEKILGFSGFVLSPWMA